MYDYLNGLGVPAEEANVKLSLLPLTKDTVEQFRKDFPEGLPQYDWKERSKVFNPEAKATFELKYSTDE